jgi:hypothetical protein
MLAQQRPDTIVTPRRKVPRSHAVQAKCTQGVALESPTFRTQIPMKSEFLPHQHKSTEPLVGDRHFARLS